MARSLLRGLALILLGGVSAGAHPSFPACTLKFKGKDYPTGVLPQSVAVADFNKDGKSDFALINNAGGGPGSLVVYLGKGDGTFAGGIVYPTGAGPDALAAADVNHDGSSDLIAANEFGSSVSVLLGKGDGTFQPPASYATGGYPHGLALADLNGDGKPDIAVANEGDNDVGILLNSGDGTFGAMKTFATGKEPWSVAAGDFNHDGKIDLALTSYKESIVSILLGNGDGTVRKHIDYATGTEPVAIVTGDFNGDRKIDLAMADYSDAGTGSVSILLGHSDGSFGTHTDYQAGAGPVGLAVVSVSLDKFADLAVTNEAGNTLSILPGNGDGTFGPQITFTTPNGPFGVAAGRFHGNGANKQDIVVTDDFNTTATVFLNKSRSCN